MNDANTAPPGPKRQLERRGVLFVATAAPILMLVLQAGPFVALLGFASERALWDAKTDERGDLSASLKSLRSDLPLLRTEVGSLKSEVATSQTRRDELSASLQSLSADQRRRQLELIDSEGKIGTLQGDRSRIEGELTQSRQELEGLQVKNDSLRAEAATLLQKTTRVSEAQQQLLRLQGEIEIKRGEFTTKEKLIANAEAQLRQINHDLAFARKQVDANQSQVDEHSDLTSQVMRLRTDAEERSRALKNQQKDSEALMSRITSLSAERDRLSASRDQLELTVQELRSEESRVRGGADAALERKNALEAALLTLGQQRTAAVREGRDARAESLRLKSEVTSLESTRAELAALRAELSALSAQQEQLSKVRQEKAALVVEVSELRNDRDQLQGQVTGLRSDVKGGLTTLRDELSTLGSTLKDLVKELREVPAPKKEG